MAYSAILVIGAIVIYLFHSKCMGLGEADMNLNLPQGSAPLHKSRCPPPDSLHRQYGEIRQSAERLDAVTKYFTEHMAHDEKHNASVEVWLELVDIQQTLRELATNASSNRRYYPVTGTRNASDPGDAPLILDYTRIFLPRHHGGGHAPGMDRLSNGTLSALRPDNDTGAAESGVVEAVKDAVRALLANVDRLGREVGDNRQSQYDHLQAVSGDILRLYESAKSQNQTAEQMKSAQAKIMASIGREINEREACSSALRDLRATVGELQRAFDEEFMLLLKNITLMDERVALVEEENNGGFYAHADAADEWAKESRWASAVREQRAGGAERNMAASAVSDNQSVSLNTTSDLQVIRGEIDYVSGELEQVVQHVQERLTEFGVKVTSLEQTIASAGAPPGKITRRTCNGMRRHMIRNSCYYIPKIPREERQYTWWDAKYVCKQQLGPRGDLVAIESNQEMEAIIDMLTNHFGGLEEFWLGGSDLDKEGTWVWSGTGKSLDQQQFTYWAEYPQISTDTNCMSLLRGYKWVDEPCFYERMPLCELRL